MAEKLRNGVGRLKFFSQFCNLDEVLQTVFVAWDDVFLCFSFVESWCFLLPTVTVFSFESWGVSLDAA